MACRLPATPSPHLLQLPHVIAQYVGAGQEARLPRGRIVTPAELGEEVAGAAAVIQNDGRDNMNAEVYTHKYTRSTEQAPFVSVDLGLCGQLGRQAICCRRN